MNAPTSMISLAAPAAAGLAHWFPVHAPAPEPAGGVITILETFDTAAQADDVRTGALWGGAFLKPGVGGGSGRLGDLRVPAGQTVVLSTDLEDFSGVGDPSIFDVTGAIDGAAALPVSGGVFDFATVRVEPGGVLRFEGSNPARLFARGRMAIEGTLDVSGGDAGDHDNAVLDGAPGAAGGPAAAAGGDGADQSDGTAFVAVGGNPNPGAMIDGADGGGIPFPSALAPTSFPGGGCGGLHHPAAFPVDVFDLGGLEFDIIFLCQTKMLGAVGGGGGYVFAGDSGVNGALSGAGLAPTIAPATCGGPALALPEAAKELVPELGLLRGGSGGGGGGSHLSQTGTDGQIFFDCTTTFGGGAAQIIRYVQHSAAAGGGGGGAAQAVAGDLFVLDGRIDASGGDGGSRIDGFSQAVPGGGGSGGSALLRARRFATALSGSIDVSGGNGGTGPGASTGGLGSPGLLRAEAHRQAPDPALFTANLEPDASELALFGGVVDDVASFGKWAVPQSGPGALSGAQSCWFKPAGGASFLDFLQDAPGTPGWDMSVVIHGVVGSLSWRGANPLVPVTLEELFGTALFNAPVVVRFQGARSAGALADPCDVELYGAGAEIVPGSLTGWVTHPSQLDTFTADPAKKPDMVRFQIVFDRNSPFANAIVAIDDLTILADPQ